eukprot:TRINITY_DN5112_c0_g1_i1.p1 TRINITY_DN5112_c0_g1~~TRINITY_DN5112_c0_g1_i1.p1  ORF type:complete len:482 (+),score=135.90 TRINITY_DN5112_c0_g1_i1:368-1813(+)
MIVGSPIPLPDQSIFENPQGFTERKKHKRGSTTPTECPSPPTKSPSVSRILSAISERIPSVTPISQGPNGLTHGSSFKTDFVGHKSIGSGSFGTVFKVKSRENKSLFAVKKKKKKYRGRTDRNEAIREFHIGREILPHPHCLRYYNAWEEDGHLYIQTELCKESLNSVLDRRRPIPEKTLWGYILDIALGLKHIHEHGYVHLDIKPGNILVGLKDGHTKIGDFGSAIDSRTQPEEIEEGDSRYMAPEVLSERSDRIGPPSDIFSFGITIYELILHNVDLPVSGPLWQSLRNDNISFEGADNHYSEELQNLVRQMMHSSPESRANIHQILSQKKTLQVLKSRINELKNVKQLRNRTISSSDNLALNIYTDVYETYLSNGNSSDPQIKDRSFHESEEDFSFEIVEDEDEDLDLLGLSNISRDSDRSVGRIVTMINDDQPIPTLLLGSDDEQDDLQSMSEDDDDEESYLPSISPRNLFGDANDD